MKKIYLPVLFFLFSFFFLFAASDAHAANLYWVGTSGAATNVALNWKTTDPASCGSGNAGAAPSTGDVAIFDPDCDNNAAITGTFDVQGVSMVSGYTGTVSQNAIAIVIGTAGWVQAGGTFTGNSNGSTANITINSGGDFSLTGGTFTSTNDTITSKDNWTVNGGTFTHNSGTVTFYSVADGAATITGNATYNNLYFLEDISSNTSTTATIASSTTLTVSGTLTFDGCTCGDKDVVNGPGAISAQGGITVLNDGMGGDVVVTINGTGAQSFTGVTSGNGSTPSIVIDKASNTLSFSNIISPSRNWTYTQGTLSMGTSTIQFQPSYLASGPSTITGSMSFYKLSFRETPTISNAQYIATIASGTTLTVTNTLTIEGDNGGGSDFINGPGAISAQGDVVALGDGFMGDVVITINGTGSQALTGTASPASDYGYLPSIVIDKSSGTLTFSNTITATANWTYTQGTLSVGSSTVRFFLGSIPVDATATITGSMTFNNLTFMDDAPNSNSQYIVTIASGTTISATGTMTLDGAGAGGADSINGPGILNPQGALTTSNNGFNGDAAITFTGSAAQTITQSGTLLPTGTVTINKTSGTATLATAFAVSGSGQDLIVASGTLDLSTFALTVADAVSITGTLTMGTGAMTMTAGTITVNAGGTFQNTSTGDLAIAGGQAIVNNGYMNFSGTTSACPEADAIALTRTASGTVALNGSGGWRMVDVTISNYAASPALTFYSSTDSGTNTGITFVNICPGEPSAYWKFDDAQGTTVQDSTPNNNDGLLNSTSWQTENMCVSGKCLKFGLSTPSQPTPGSADIQIDSSTEPGQNFAMHKSGIVWTSSSVGYDFILDDVAVGGAGRVSYKKTTDSGQTWGAAVAVTTYNSTRFSVWFDQETSGDTGTKIHITYNDDTGDRLYYRNLNTSGDSLGTEVNIAATGTNGTADGTYFGSGYSSITKARGGNLYIFAFFGDGTNGLFYRSTDGGANWTSRSTTNLRVDGEISGNNDLIQLIPSADTDNQDIAAIWLDESATALKFLLFDDSANSWGTSTTIDNTLVTGGDWYDGTWGFDVAVRHSDNKAIVAYWSEGLASATSDYRVKELTLTAAGAAATAKTDVLTNTNNAAGESVFINNNTGDIYVAYLLAPVGEPANDVKYKKSTDGGTSWGSAVQVNATTRTSTTRLSTVSGLRNGASGRYMPVWDDFDNDDVYTNYSNSLALGSEYANVSANTVPVVKSVSLWVKPTSFSSTTAIIDLNGTAKITTDGSGVITATSFTSPTIYVNGQVGTTLTANVWQHLVVTTATAIQASAIKIGSDGTNGLTGFLDDAKLYSVALSADQVKADFNARGNAEGISQQQGNNNQNLPNVLSNGLVGYWKMDESAANSCTGGSNDSCDSSGNANDGTWNGNAAQTTGKFANGTTYDGTGDYIDIPSSTNYDSTTTTWAGWIKTSSSTQNMHIMSRADSSGSSPGLIVFLNNTGTITAEFKQNSIPQVDLTTTATVNNGSWHHWAVTAQGSGTATVYIDGKREISGTANTFTTSTYPVRIGVATDSFWANFNGQHDEIRIYNRALSNNEVKQLYNWAPGPVGYWKMDEAGWNGTSGEVKDSSGNGTNGTGSGSVTTGNGKYGKGGVFDGSDDTVTITRTVGKDFTIGLWINTKAVGGNGDWYVGKGLVDSESPGVANDFGLAVVVNQAGFGVGNPDTTIRTIADVNDGKWHYIAATREQSTGAMKIYLDGVFQATGTGNTNDLTAASNITFGSIQTGSNFLLGKLDDIRIYNYVRNSAQIVEDMNAGHPAPGSPVGTPVGWWKFNEGADNTCSGGTNDVCNSGNSGNTFDGITTAARSTAGKYGGALDYNGSTHVTTITNANSIDYQGGLSNFTYSAWVYPDTDGEADVGQIFFKTGTNYLRVDTESGSRVDVEASVDLATTDATVNVSSAIPTGSWSYVAETWDGTTLNVYINGQLRGTSSSGSGALAADGDLLIGGTTTANFDGKIDEFKVYNSALTASQIMLDMNQSSTEVLGALSDKTGTGYESKTSANQEYCIPGDSSTCTAPVGEWKMEEKTGQVFNDTSGNGNIATLGTSGGSESADPTWSIGKVGAGLNFDGSDDEAYVADSSNLRVGGGDLTIEAWIYPQAFGSYNALFEKGQGTAGTREYHLAINSPGTDGWVAIGSPADSGAAISFSPGFSTGSWQHIVLRRSGTTAQVYRNGQLVGSATQSGTTTQTTNFLIIGRASSSAFWNGKIDQMRIFGYARSPAQIAWDYNRGGPVAYWKMDECQGTTINDSSGNANTGTLSIGASGSEDTVGTCTTSSTAWFNGVTGKRNSSVDFDGTDDKVTISDMAEPSGAVSLSAWVKMGTVATDQRIISKWGNTAGEEQYVLTTDDSSSNRFSFAVSSGSSNLDECDSNSSGIYTTGVWYLVTGTYDATTCKIYINGVDYTNKQTDAASGNSQNTSVSVRIGIEGDDGTSKPLDGQIDDARIYNYGLTPTQVKTLYNEGAARYGPVTGAP